jgi:hypothetical protein
MKNNRKVPINRVNKFFSEDDFELEKDFGREWSEGDMNFKVILYRVDRDNTLFDEYGEADAGGIRYLAPLELVVSGLIIEEPIKKGYLPNGSVRYVEPGKLTFGIYQDYLDEVSGEITYGDYIGYQTQDSNNLTFYTVADAGEINTDNKHTILGYKGFYRTIKCVAADESEFNGE